MPLSRLLLPLCGLLLAVAVTSATAAAPSYGPGEVKITMRSASSTTSRSGQITYCSSLGGSLVPMVTEAVYNLLTTTISNAGVRYSLSYMGASSMLSSSVCTGNKETLECIWYWDEGRYAGIANAVPFYKGNRDPRILKGATMLGTSVENHWRVYSDAERCPCGYHDRYGVVLRDNSEAKPYWADATATSYKYTTLPSSYVYTLCAVEQTTTTATTTTTTPAPTTTTTTTTPAPTTTTTATTPAPTTTQTTTVRPTTTTTAEPSEGIRRLNRPLVVGFAVASAAVVVVLVVLLSLSPL